jgi:hypothetical protein
LTAKSRVKQNFGIVEVFGRLGCILATETQREASHHWSRIMQVVERDSQIMVGFMKSPGRAGSIASKLMAVRCTKCAPLHDVSIAGREAVGSPTAEARGRFHPLYFVYSRLVNALSPRSRLVLAGAQLPVSRYPSNP